jgi:hypothetical protein
MIECNGRRDLREQLQHLAGKCAFCVGKAGDIAAWVGWAGNETLTHRVADDNKYNRDRPRFPLESSGHRCRVCENGVGC